MPTIDRRPAIGIAISGMLFAAIEVNLFKAINPLPDKSPNLEINVSMKTVDLYLSFFLNELKIVSLVGLFTPYSNILKDIVTKATDIIDGASPYIKNAIQNKTP